MEPVSERVKAALGRVKAELANNGSRISLAGTRYTSLGNPRIELARARAVELRNAMRPSLYTLEFMTILRLQGLSLRAIAERLNTAAAYTASGARWYASTVKTELSRLPEFQKSRDPEMPISYMPPLSVLNRLKTPDKPSVGVPQRGARAQPTEGKELMPYNTQEGQRMLDLFASVGADSFVVTKLDINKNILWGKPYSARELREKLIPMMRTAAVAVR